MRTSFSVYSDAVFVFLSSFLLSFIAFYYYTPYPYSLVFSVALSVAVFLFFLSVAKKKTARAVKSKAEENKYESVMLNLSVLDFSEQADFFCSLLKKIGESTVKTENAVKSTDGTFILPRFSFSPVDKDEIVKTVIFNPAGVKVYAQSFTEEERTFFSRFDAVTLIDGKEAFEKMKKADFYPIEIVKPAKKRRKIKFFLPFEKKKAVSFLLYGLFFLSFSFLVPIKVYYLAFGSVFVISALLIRLFGRET